MNRLWALLIIGLCNYVSGTMTSLEDAEISDDLTCFTCSESSSNHLCNRYALDRPCSSGLTFCQSVHTMDGTGTTMTVAKRCVSTLDCVSDSVGCAVTDNDGAQICIACCDYSYCNEFLPTNHSTAVIIRTKGNGSQPVFGGQSVLILPCLALLVWLRLFKSDDVAWTCVQDAGS